MGVLVAVMGRNKAGSEVTSSVSKRHHRSHAGTGGLCFLPTALVYGAGSGHHTACRVPLSSASAACVPTAKSTGLDVNFKNPLR